MPEDWLYHTLQVWPVPSDTGETLLFRRNGDRVLFLNELRFRKDSSLKFSVPVAAHNLLAGQVLRGEAHPGKLLQGEDYRGIDSVGVYQAVPGSDWFLIAKIDRAELLIDARRDATWILLTALLATFLAAIATHLLRQHQQLAVAETVRLSQNQRLRALHLLAAIADSSEDAIFAKDLDGRYILFNRAACGYVGKAVEAVLGHDDRELFPANEADMVIAISRQAITENRFITQEEVLHTPRGERIFLATKGPLRGEDGTIIGSFGISRDITDRKQTLENLEHQTEELKLRNDELERFNRAMVGRELDMIELKRQANAMARELGREPPYPLAFLDEMEESAGGSKV